MYQLPCRPARTSVANHSFVSKRAEALLVSPRLDAVLKHKSLRFAPRGLQQYRQGRCFRGAGRQRKTLGDYVAEGEGFEPPGPFRAQRFSSGRQIIPRNYFQLLLSASGAGFNNL
jgi:hypothetical protein